jgi:endonuclease-3
LRTPEDGVALWVEKIKSCINTLGFFNNKAKNIFTTCKILVENEGKIPKTIEELLKLPWVWIKTAKVFLAISENAPYIGVDTHVHRVLNRLGLVKTKNPLETDKAISCSPQWGGYHEVTGGVFTKKDHARLHHTLVLFWRYYCTAKKPKCEICAFKVKCDFYKKSQK